MKASRVTATLIAAVAIAALLLALDAVAPQMTVARERGSAIAVGASHLGLAPIQGTEAQDDGQRVPVQLWTVLAAGGAAGVGLVLFLLRIALGRVKPPPPQEEARH